MILLVLNTNRSKYLFTTESKLTIINNENTVNCVKFLKLLSVFTYFKQCTVLYNTVKYNKAFQYCTLHKTMIILQQCYKCLTKLYLSVIGETLDYLSFRKKRRGRFHSSSFLIVRTTKLTRWFWNSRCMKFPTAEIAVPIKKNDLKSQNIWISLTFRFPSLILLTILVFLD